MKRKWWIVGILVLLKLLVCGGILLTLWAGRTAFGGIRFFYRADTHIEETVGETFVVDGPAVLDLEAVAGNVTVTGGTEDEVQVTARLSLWGADEEDARQQVDVQMTQFDKKHVAGEVNGGGPLLRINTSSGDVTLESATGESN